jgi:hypothetical protein
VKEKHFGQQIVVNARSSMMLFLPKMPMGSLSPGASIMMHQGIAISLLLLQPLKGFGTLLLILTPEIV